MNLTHKISLVLFSDIDVLKKVEENALILYLTVTKMEEVTQELASKKYELRCACTCSSDDILSEKVEIPERKQFILSTVSRTETYLRERRIPELIRFLFTKIISEAPDKPITFLEKLLDDCMLFRAGHGLAPVLYDSRHLEAVIKSFDPGNRGWLSSGQVRRIYTTLGLSPENSDKSFEERHLCDMLLEKIKTAQETELYDLLSAGQLIETLIPKLDES